MAMFIWGFSGSAAVEIVALSQFFYQTPIIFPERYKRFWFYPVRIILAVMGGGLAVAYDIDKPLLALNIGASAPLIITALSQAIPKRS